MRGFKTTLALLSVASAVFAYGDGDQQFADIGDLKLQSGAMLRDCRVGYRTFGTLDGKKDNAVLVPTWYLGTTNDLKNSFRPGGLVDSSKYYVVAVDALTNGVSTSPSNSKTQHDADFPAITVRDMVESQHKMLLGLGIRHLRAVMGISMGGMQTFQWITTYPDFMDKAVPIVGSPQPTSYDLMFYASALKTLKAAIANESARTDLIKSYADFFWLALNTPSYYVQHTPRQYAIASLNGFEKALLAWDPYDMAAGIDALVNLDCFAPFGESEATCATTVKAKLLVIVAQQDHCANPAPALSFAKALNAQVLILPGNEGHSSPGANMSKISPMIDEFLRSK